MYWYATGTLEYIGAATYFLTVKNSGINLGEGEPFSLVHENLEHTNQERGYSLHT